MYIGMETNAHIHSLEGEMRPVTVVEDRGNDFVVDYNGTYCTAIFNPFVGAYYADDKYGVLKEYTPPSEHIPAANKTKPTKHRPEPERGR